MTRWRFLLLPVLLLTVGCIPQCGGRPVDEEVVPIAREQPQNVPSVNGGGDVGEVDGIVAQEEALPVTQEEIESPPTIEPEVQREPEFIPQALSWALGTRDLLAKIGKLLAIEEGRYELKEGESRPDLHGMYTALSVSLKTIDASHEDAVLRGLMHEIDQKITEIIGGFSNPPTAEELRNAQESKGALDSKIDALYKYLDELRKREAATAG